MLPSDYANVWPKNAAKNVVLSVKPPLKKVLVVLDICIVVHIIL